MSGRRRRRKADVAEVRHGLDMGTALALERGTVEIQDSASVPLDPDSPRSPMRIQPQARKVWAPDNLTRGRNPALRPYHHDAATRYLEDWLIGEHGANPRRRTGHSTRLDPWSRIPYAEQRAVRRQSLEQANQALASLGPDLTSILTWTVLQVTPSPTIPPTVESWARAKSPNPWGTERAVGILIAALEVLSNHYGYTPRRRRS